MKGEILKKETGLTIVRLQGSPYQMGFQHGELFREELKWLKENFEKNLEKLEGKIARLSLPIFKFWARRLEKLFPKNLQEEMRGIANGAKVDYNFILLVNLINELATAYFWYFKTFLPCFLCSGFAVKTNQDILIARNLDYAILVENLPAFNVMFIYFPEKEEPFISLAFPGYIGVTTGLSKNLFLATFNSPVKYRFFRIIPHEIVNRQLIQENNELSSVAEKLIPQPGIIGQNLLISSKKEKDVWVVEISPFKKSIRKLQSYLVITNHFQAKEMATEQDADCYKGPKNSNISPDFYTLEGSLKRMNIIKKELENSSKDVDEEKAKRILRMVSGEGTIQSIIFSLKKEEFWLAKRNQPPVTEGEWESFKLKDLFNS